MVYRVEIQGSQQLLDRFGKLADPVRTRKIVSTALRTGQKSNIFPEVQAEAPVRQKPYTGRMRSVPTRSPHFSAAGRRLKRRPGSLRQAARVRASRYQRGGKVAILTNLRRTEFMQDAFYPAFLTYGTKERVQTTTGRRTGRIAPPNNFELRAFKKAEAAAEGTVMTGISAGLTSFGV
jgi:hypothetical protein